jgi:hypothetical protein
MNNIVIDNKEFNEYDLMHEKMNEKLKEKKIKVKNKNEKNIEKIEKIDKNDKKNENENENISLMAIPLTQSVYNAFNNDFKGITVEEQKELCLCMGESFFISKNNDNIDTKIEFILQLGMHVCMFVVHIYMYVYKYMHMYICISICIYIYVYIYTYIYRKTAS